MTEVPAPTGDVDRPRVLVADDSAAQRASLAELLENAGYAVDEAQDGGAVLLYLRSRPCDLLLLDLHMPGTDGFAVLAEIQANNIDLPVILLSGLPPEEIQHSIHRLPSRSLPPLLLKPVDPDQLLDVIALRLGGELPA
jgi:two-component system, sensor histidine kinase